MRPHIIAGRRVAVLASFAVSVTGCELGEVVVPPSDPIVIVQAIMRPDRAQQWMLIEQSLSGATSGFVPSGSASGARVLPRSSLATPVAGAAVTIANLSRPGDPCGPAVRFVESLAPDTTIAGLYYAPAGCPTILVGDTLDLRIESEGVVVTGRSIVPATGDLVLRSRAGSVVLPAPAATFNRDVDTLTAEITAATGRGLYLTVHPRPSTAGRELISGSDLAWFLVDSTAMTLPGDFVNIFEANFEFDDDVPDLFEAGRHYVVTVAHPDTNFFDYLRSGNSPLSGRGFINNLVGGFGLFGSMVVGTSELRVVGTVDDPRERTYRFQGVVDGAQVDLQFELYVGRPLPKVDEDSDRFAAFVTGDWVHGALDHSIDGLLRGTTMEASVEQGTGSLNDQGFPATQAWTIRATLSPDGGTLTVIGEDGQIWTLEQVPPSG